MAFEFQYDEDGYISTRSAIGQAIGAASMCWSETPKGVFDSDRVKEICDTLYDALFLEVKG